MLIQVYNKVYLKQPFIIEFSCILLIYKFNHILFIYSWITLKQVLVSYVFFFIF